MERRHCELLRLLLGRKKRTEWGGASLLRQPRLAVPFLKHCRNFRWIVSRGIFLPSTDCRLRIKLQQPPDPAPRFVYTSKVGARDQLDTQSRSKAGVFAPTPVCPFHGLLILPRGQMRQGKPATEEITERVERAQLHRSLKRLYCKPRVVLKALRPALCHPGMRGIWVEF
jgi:hypothetical protein